MYAFLESRGLKGSDLVGLEAEFSFSQSSHYIDLIGIQLNNVECLRRVMTDFLFSVQAFSPKFWFLLLPVFPFMCPNSNSPYILDYGNQNRRI